MAERGVAQMMRTALKKVAPGTTLREGIDMIVSGRTGALIVLADPQALDALCDGGFTVDMPFTPQRLFELAKMDGAITVDAECSRILRANVHLLPDSSLPTVESGMRHRTAERISQHKGVFSIAVSGRRSTVSLYLKGQRAHLEDIEVLLAKANQAIQTMQNYRIRLTEVLEHLTVLEFDDLVTLGDVSEVIARFEMLDRVSREVSGYTLQLGTEGRLISMQADEYTAGVLDRYVRVLRDYSVEPAPRRVSALRARLAELSLESLLEPGVIARELGISIRDEGHLRSRGYRVLDQVPMLPKSVVERLVEAFGTLRAISFASVVELDAVAGVGSRRAKAITGGLARIRRHAAPI